VYVNGDNSDAGAVPGGAGLLTADDQVFIGVAVESYVGDISEVIMFNRGLKLNERNEIQEYLSKKYSIKVTESIS
jgi:D-tyrosyl-tRNA(Tyr) deacylase